jgi:hypothetical protein
MARFVGTYLVLFALLVLVATGAAYATRLNMDLMVVVLGLGVLGLIGLSWWLRNVVVVRLSGDGYRIRMVRGAGIKEARWSQVEDVVPTTPRGIECVTLRLRDGGTSNIPVNLLAGDKDEFARDVRHHLEQAGR